MALLLKHGASLKANSQGLSPYELAVAMGKQEIIELLQSAEKKAEPSISHSFFHQHAKAKPSEEEDTSLANGM